MKRKQCEECGHLWADLDMGLCLCGGALVSVTVRKGRDPIATPLLTAEEARVDRMMRGNRGVKVT